jgi:hypothetical protein
MYPSNVKFVYSSAGLPDDDHHTVIVVNASSPTDEAVDRDLILTLSTHYDTVTVVLKVPEIASLKKTKILNHENDKHYKNDKTYNKTYTDDARPTCSDGDCLCESCVSQRAWDERYDANTGVLK